MSREMPLRVAGVARPGSGALLVLNDLLGRELAGHLGLSFVPIGYRSMDQLVRGEASHDWDVACLPLGGDRPSRLEFTPPYLNVESAYLVPATGPIRCIEDADHLGVRIVVAQDSPAANRLATLLRHARLRRVASEKVAMRHLNRGDAEVVAGLRVDLLRLADENDGYWVLMDPVFELSYALAVPRGDSGLLNEAAAFVGRMTDSGLISKQIDQNHWAGVHATEISNALSTESVAWRRGGS
jgi:polar amino acid transport system substrate-binding protein